jgi:hypothetical protein
MTPQETKALLDVLNRIAKALESKDKNNPVEIVNRFAEVYRMLDDLTNKEVSVLPEEYYPLISFIKKAYIKIAGDIIN